MGYTVRKEMRIIVLLLLAVVVCIRLAGSIEAWLKGINGPLMSYVFCVIFPASLALLLLLMPATRTREGLLMRFGTILQLLLILYIPSFALYLALGLPVVFLAVELFVTRVPSYMSAPLERLVLA
jgi:hypothetical protein